MRIVVCLLFTLSVTGCIQSGKQGSGPPLTKAASLFSFEGCYRNRGTSESGEIAPYLTQTIWPGAGLKHTEIDAVRVETLDKETLRVSALTRHVIVQQRIFLLGQDFEFKTGHIKISHTRVSTASEPGNPFIGVAVSTTSLGLDSAGNGRTEDKTSLAGTAFLIVPLAGKFGHSATYERSDSLCSVGE